MKLTRFLFFIVAILTISCSGGGSGETTPEELVAKSNNILIDAVNKSAEEGDDDFDLKKIFTDSFKKGVYDEEVILAPYYPKAIEEYGDIVCEFYCAYGAELSEKDIKLMALTHKYAPAMYAMNAFPIPEKYEVVNSAILQDGVTAVVKGRMCFTEGAEDPFIEEIKVLKMIEGKWKIDINLSQENAEGYSDIIAEYEKLISEK